MTAPSPNVSAEEASLAAMSKVRELRIESGPVVIVQTITDPGDMGEPRVVESDGVTYVCVPDFETGWLYDESESETGEAS